MYKLFYYIGHSLTVPVLAMSADAANAISGSWSPLVNLGAIGCVLAWFLIRAEPRMGRIERAIDRSTRGNLVLALVMADVAEGRDVTEVAKKQATNLIREIDDATDERRDK